MRAVIRVRREYHPVARLAASPGQRARGAVPETPAIFTVHEAKTGKNAGKSPPVASLYRALAEAEDAAAEDGLPL
ncbi:hypothetical protein ACFWSF_24325 [Streptomyces sp. NPDC058611]|uniref:hypothetical protein n=1 Tax=unclassified Streptomyces TaxID=2593676 RepID=UPI003658A46E